MKKFKLLLTVGALAVLSLNASAKMSEGDYVDKFCTGTVEYLLPDKTRVDCDLPKESQEYDWQTKWYEGVGQALYYSMSTGKGGGLVLIAKNDKWKKYTDRAKATILHYDLPLSLYVIKPNAKNITLLYHYRSPVKIQNLLLNKFNREYPRWVSGVS